MIASALLAAALGLPSLGRDVEALWLRPSPASVLSVAADAAGFVPHSRPIAIGLTVMAFMARFPSQNPIADAQTSLGRGGRRP